MNGKILVIGAVIVAVGLLIFSRFSGNNVSFNGIASIHNRTSLSSARTNTAPNFTLQKLGGGTISLSEFKGKKAVVVDFWASWCPNCRRDMPKMNAMYPKYQDKVEIIGINLHENESTVRNFISSNGINFPIALDPRSQASQSYGIQYTNTHFLIDIEGNLVRTVPGDIRESDIASLVEEKT